MFVSTYTYVAIQHVFIAHLVSATKFARCWYVCIFQSVSIALDIFSKDTHLFSLSKSQYLFDRGLRGPPYLSGSYGRFSSQERLTDQPKYSKAWPKQTWCISFYRASLVNTHKETPPTSQKKVTFL